MTPMTFVRCSLSLAALALILLGRGEGGSQAAEYKTPEEAFAALKAAAQKEDFKTLCYCLTDESQELMAGQVIDTAATLITFAQLNGKAAEAKELAAILHKHGVTEAVLKELEKRRFVGTPQDIRKAVRALAGPVKDRCALVAEGMSAVHRIDKDLLEDNVRGAELKNLQTRGNAAKGVMVTKRGEQPIGFKKVGNSWRIEMPMEAMK